MNRVKTLLVGFYALLLGSLAWLVTIWIRFGISNSMETAAYLFDDLLWLGPVAFIFDLLVFYFIFRWLLNRPKCEDAPPSTPIPVSPGSKPCESLSSLLNSKTNK